jgi:hypothetical protein
MALASAGKCPFGFDNESSLLNNPHPIVKSSAAYPKDIFTCTANAGTTGIGIPTTTNDFDQDKYSEIFDDVVALYDTVDDTATANNNPRAKFAGCIVRTGGHDFMDFRIAVDGTTSGGADGCIDFADADNTGLADCLEASGIADVYQNHCTTVSLADFIVIAGEAVAARTSGAWNVDDRWKKGTAANAVRNNFKAGRTSAETCDQSAASLMPNPENGCAGL